MNNINLGLEGVVVGCTGISDVDGAAGRLSYRGHDIEQLVERPFLQVAWLVLFGEYPSLRQEQQLAHFLLEHRRMTQWELAALQSLPADTHPMLVLQALVPVLELEQRASIDLPFGGDDALHGLIIAARLPTLIANWYQWQRNETPAARNNSIDPHRAFLQSLHGREPDPLAVASLDRAQILQMEHSYNAGTFAGRVCLSTRAPIQSSLAASLGTLFGALHGGADQAALEFATQVGEPDNAARAVKELVASGGRVMGIGHREYRTLDPRAALLLPMARDLCATDPESARLLATLEAIEAACTDQLQKPGKVLRANVEFYKGAVFHALGIPSRFFTAVFAMSRVWGYIAHALEFRPDSRLIRPRALYKGRDNAAA